MKNKLGNLDRALAKVKPFSHTRQWCGFLTPSEIIALLEYGVKPANKDDYLIERSKKLISEGKSYQVWFYFYPNGVKMRS